MTKKRQLHRVVLIDIAIIVLFILNSSFDAHSAPTPAVLRLLLPTIIVAAFLRPLLIYLMVTLMTIPLVLLRHTPLNDKARTRWRLARILAIVGFFLCLAFSGDPFAIATNPVVLLCCTIGGIARAHLSFSDHPDPTTSEREDHHGPA